MPRGLQCSVATILIALLAMPQADARGGGGGGGGGGGFHGGVSGFHGGFRGGVPQDTELPAPSLSTTRVWVSLFASLCLSRHARSSLVLTAASASPSTALPLASRTLFPPNFPLAPRGEVAGATGSVR
jgi:hypothetical protein